MPRNNQNNNNNNSENIIDNKKKIPNFKNIYPFPIRKNGDIFILPRIAKDNETVKFECFKKEKSNGAGYFSLGILQVDETGKLVRDEEGNPVIKKATKNDEFPRFILELPSVLERFPQTSAGELLQLTKDYENGIRRKANNAYHFGKLNAKPAVKESKDKNYSGKEKYYIVMDGIDGVNLNRYLKENQNIDLHNKMLIARNIAQACQRHEDENMVHDNLKPDNFMINPRTFAVRPVGYSKAKLLNDKKQAESYVKNIEYSAVENLNATTVSNPAIITTSSDVYSQVAIVIDLIIMQPLSATFSSAYSTFCQPIAKQNLVKYMEMMQNDMQTEAWLQYFGKRNLQPLIFESVTFNGIEMSRASFDRVTFLSHEMKGGNYGVLSDETISRFIDLCTRGLAIDPSKRPSQQELVDVLADISKEFQINIQKELIDFLNSKINELNEKTVDFKNKSEEINELQNMIVNFSKKEKITKKDIAQFKKNQIENTLKQIEIGELVKKSEDVSNEERMNIQCELSSFVEKEFARIERKFPAFNKKKEEVDALYSMIVAFSKKENLTKQDIKSFKSQTLKPAFMFIENKEKNKEKINEYLGKINNKIEEKITALPPNVELKDMSGVLRRKLTPTKQDLEELESQIKGLAMPLCKKESDGDDLQNFANKANQLIDAFSYSNNISFFTSIKKAINEKPELVQPDYSKYMNKNS